MKSATHLLVGALVVIAIIAIIKKRFFEVLDYDLPTQGNALRFGIEGYEDAEASEVDADADADEDAEEIEGYEDEDEGDEDVDDEEVASKKVHAKLRATAKKLKAKKPKTDAASRTAAVPPAATATAEKFENTSRFQELKARWDAYKANTGPALTEEERNELIVLLDMPDESAAHDEPAAQEAFEQFAEMPYQGTEYAMF